MHKQMKVLGHPKIPQWNGPKIIMTVEKQVLIKYSTIQFWEEFMNIMLFKGREQMGKEGT